MSRSSTVILCCNTAFAIANYRSGVIRELVGRGHRVMVVAPRDHHVDALKAIGAEFVHWEMSGRSTGPLAQLAALSRLVRIYRELRADIAFHFTIKSVLYGAIAGRLTCTPFISVFTGLGYVFTNETLLSVLARWMYRRMLPWSKQLWFLNADDHQEFVRRRLVNSAVQVDVLPGEGVDLGRFAPAPMPPHQRTSEVVFLMIARLIKDKGVLELVEAARKVRLRHPDVRVRLLGAVDNGNPTAITQAQLDTWCAEGVVEYLGVRHDVRRCIAEADAVVLPSYREGIPRALLEAAAMCRPIIATDVPGCRPRDATDLGRCIDAFLAHTPTERAAMGQRGRRLIEQRYDERKVIAKYIDVIEG